MTHGPLNLDDLRRRARQALEQATSRTQTHPAVQEHDWPKLVEELGIYQAELEIQNDELANAQNAVVRSLSTYQLLFECLPQPAVVLDSRGFIEEANAQAIQFLGLASAKALIRRSIIQFFDTESRSRLHPLLRPTPDALPPVRVRIKTGGEEIPCAVHVIHLPGEDTATTRILLVIADLRTELALRESEQNLRRVLEHSPIPMSSYRLKERREVLFVNREFTRTVGYTLEEVTTVEQWEALAFPDPAYRKQSFSWWQEAEARADQEQGAVPSREFRVVCKDGGIRDVDVSAAIVDDCVIVSFVDVTHRNEIERRLRDSEARHRLWADNSADVVWTMGLNGRFTYLSPSVTQVLGRTPEETMAMAWDEIFTPDSLAIVQRGFAQVMADVAAGRPVQFHERLEERRGYGGNATAWTEVRATGLYDAEGRFIEILGMTRDITEQKRIEDELRATRDRLEATLNALPDFMFRVDRQGRVRDCHITVGDPFLWPPDEIMGRPLAEILPESASQVILAALGEAAERGRHQGGVYALPTPGGVVWHELSVAAMAERTTEDAEFILLARDITRRKQQEEDLRISEERHRILAENTREVIWAMQLDGSISYVSPAVEQVRGVTPEEARRQPIEEILTPAAQAEAASYFQKLIAAVQAGELSRRAGVLPQGWRNLLGRGHRHPHPARGRQLCGVAWRLPGHR